MISSPYLIRIFPVEPLNPLEAALQKAFLGFCKGLVNCDLAKRLNKKRSMEMDGLAFPAVQRLGKGAADGMMTDPKEKLLIDIHELSALTGIAVGTLYHWCSERKLPCVRLGARCLRFSLPAIREWLAEQSEPATNETTRRGLGRCT